MKIVWMFHKKKKDSSEQAKNNQGKKIILAIYISLQINISLELSFY